MTEERNKKQQQMYNYVKKEERVKGSANGKRRKGNTYRTMERTREIKKDRTGIKKARAKKELQKERQIES